MYPNEKSAPPPLAESCKNAKELEKEEENQKFEEKGGLTSAPKKNGKRENN